MDLSKKQHQAELVTAALEEALESQRAAEEAHRIMEERVKMISAEGEQDRLRAQVAEDEKAIAMERAVAAEGLKKAFETGMSGDLEEVCAPTMYY